MQKGEEYRLQSAAVSWFRMAYPQYIMFSVPNEATYRNKQYFSALGTVTGASDTVIVLTGKVLFVEFKSKTGRQSLEQKQFEQKVTELGHPYYVVRSFDEFHNLIESELK